MLDITDPKLYQNFFSIEIQLTLFVIVVLFCALTVLRICKMDLLRASQNKQRFYRTYDVDIKSPTLKMLQAAAASALSNDQAVQLPDTPPLSSQASTSSQRTSSESALSVNMDSPILTLPASIANDYINNSPHRTCDMCKTYEKTLEAARTSLENTACETRWSESQAKATLTEYEEFIQKMIRSHERLQIDNEVVKLHVRNLNLAFENLQTKYDKAKQTIVGLQRNEKSLLAQLSKYDTMFLLISDVNRQYQDREREKLESKLSLEKPKLRKASRSIDKQIDTDCD